MALLPGLSASLRSITRCIRLCPGHAVQVRVYSSRAPQFLSRHAADGVSSRLELVYSRENAQYLPYTADLTVVVLAPCVLMALTECYRQRENLTAGLNVDNPLVPAVVCTLFSIYSLCTVLFLVRRQLMRIYACEETGRYTAVYKRYPLRLTKLEFAQQDVVARSKGHAIFGNYHVKGKSFFVNDNAFKSSQWYNKFNGYS